MTPIVNGLEADYDNSVAFQYLNALDNSLGEQAFSLLNLRGHPSYVVFDQNGNEVYRAVGIIDREMFREVLDGM